MSSREMCNVCGEYTEHIDGECIQCKQRNSIKTGLKQFMQEMSPCNKEIELIEDEKSIRQYIDNTSDDLKYNYGVMVVAVILGLLFTAAGFSATAEASNVAIVNGKRMAVNIRIVRILLALIPFVVCTVAGYLACIEKPKRNRMARIGRIQALQRDLDAAKKKIIQTYENSSKYTSLKYIDPNTLKNIHSILEDRRASNMTDALKIYEDDLYHSKVLKNQAAENQRLAYIEAFNALTAFNTSYLMMDRFIDNMLN